MLKAVDESALKTLKAEQDPSKILFIAQMPPPVHGVTMMSRRVRTMIEAMPSFSVEHFWLGGARTLNDVGKANLRKITGFGWLCTRLVWRMLTLQRYGFTYQTLAPHGDAALRDGIIIALSKRLTKRALVHLHTQGLEEILFGTSRRQRLLRKMIEGTELIAISGHVADMARRSGIFSRVHDLPNLVVDPGNYNSAPNATLRCGYLGNYDPRKGVLRFIDSIAAIRAVGITVEASIAGGATKHLSVDDVRAYAERRGVGDIVTVLGFISEEDKFELLRNLDLFIYPTDHDLAPLVVLEAMALSAVPIVFDTGGLREMVGPEFADHVIAEKQDAKQFTARIASLVKEYAADPARLAAAKVSARQRYERNYTPEIYQQRLFEILSI